MAEVWLITGALALIAGLGALVYSARVGLRGRRYTSPAGRPGALAPGSRAEFANSSISPPSADSNTTACVGGPSPPEVRRSI
jgi:hypothetical protein